jgi:glutathione synthase
VKSTLVIVGDMLRTLNPKGDTSLALAEAALRKKWNVFWIEPKNIQLDTGNVIFSNLIELTVPTEFENYFETNQFSFEQSVLFSQKLLQCQTSHSNSNLTSDQVDLALIRTDPPFNDNYRDTCWILSLLERSGTTKVLNFPSSLLSNHEKLLPWIAVQEKIIDSSNIAPTFLFQPNSSAEKLIDFQNKLLNSIQWGEEFVTKPWDGHGGRGVEVFSNAQKTLNFLSSVSTKYLVQPLLNEVKTTGDKRIFVSGGKVEFAFTRLPQGNKIASNLAQGGKAELCELAPHQKHLAEKLAIWLLKKGIFIAGIDMIGDIINEINITSPTGVRAYESLTNKNAHSGVFDSLLATSTLHVNSTEQ